MEDIQGKVFSDFKPKTITDGSYGGMKEHSDATKEHYDMKFEQELLKVNQRLKSSKTKVSIEATKGALQLRATLPLKPDETHPQGKDKKQYKISLGIPANFPGLKTAEEEAYELGRLIARKMFIWSDKYLGVQAIKDKGITFREFYEQLEDRYFEKRKKTIRSENTFRLVKSIFLNYMISDDMITYENLRKNICKTKTPNTREKAISVAFFIAKELSVNSAFSDLKLKIKREKRDIPCDKKIVASYSLFDKYLASVKSVKPKSIKSNKVNKLVYGLLATYGLRPREIFNKPDLDWFISPENIHNTFKVHESNKTGYREVFPFVPDWIELFDLKNQDAIELLKTYTTGSKSVSYLCGIVTNLGKAFTSAKMEFKPYDLRHACAIRAHLQGIPVKASADNLGHSVDMHTKVYQQWFGLENRRKAFDNAFESVNEVDALKDENTQLKKRIAELETELARYKLGKMM